MEVDEPNLHALLLDNNEASRLLLEYALAMARIDYIHVETPQAVLDAWWPGNYQFAFLNVDLDKEEDFALTRQLRESDSKVAIVICSINDDPVKITAAVAAGCDLYLVKPFHLDMLLTLMKIINADNLRAAPFVLVIDDRLRPRWEARPALNTEKD